jgi:hypothetical protein
MKISISAHRLLVAEKKSVIPFGSVTPSHQQETAVSTVLPPSAVAFSSKRKGCYPESYHWQKKAEEDLER